MKGIINILKPPGMTSHDVINFLRKSLLIKKIGHSGTLDPAAAGVLPVFIGKATKAIEFFESDDKEYFSELILGVNTDTADVMGNITKVSEVDVNLKEVKQTLKSFVGDIEQVPPMFSAVRYKGKRLYELARKGITVKRKPRKITIKSIKLLDFHGTKLIFRVHCSKGTYIRTLCEDIGEKLGCGGYLSCLVRTRSGVFTIDRSISLEEFEDTLVKGNLNDIIIPIDKALPDMPKIKVNLKYNNNFTKGRVFSNLNVSRNLKGKHVKVYDKDKFLGIAVVERNRQKSYVRILKSFV